LESALEDAEADRGGADGDEENAEHCGAARRAWDLRGSRRDVEHRALHGSMVLVPRAAAQPHGQGPGGGGQPGHRTGHHEPQPGAGPALARAWALLAGGPILQR